MFSGGIEVDLWFKMSQYQYFINNHQYIKTISDFIYSNYLLS